MYLSGIQTLFLNILLNSLDSRFCGNDQEIHGMLKRRSLDRLEDTPSGGLGWEWQNCHFCPTYIYGGFIFKHFAGGRNMELPLVFWIPIFMGWHSKTLDFHGSRNDEESYGNDKKNQENDTDEGILRSQNTLSKMTLGDMPFWASEKNNFIWHFKFFFYILSKYNSFL